MPDSASRVALSDRYVDLEAGEVVLPSGRVRLSPVELRLFAYLVAHPGVVVARDALWRDVWAGEPSPTSRAIDTTIRRLRGKIEPDPSSPRHVVSVYGEGYRFEPASDARAPTPTDALTAEPGLPIGNLPPLPAPLVGRADLLAALVGELRADRRILTLVGPAGVGKTALALAIGAMVRADLPGGAWFCDLTQARDGADVIVRIAATMGERLPDPTAPDAAARLAERIVHRGRMLLVLDDADRVARDDWAALRHAAARVPDVSVLVTARAPLEQGDNAFHVAPLDEDAATTLFVAHAARVSRVDDLDPAELRALTSRLDRLPLALALAAARMALLTPTQLLARLEARFDLLRDPMRPGHDGGERHASLRAAIDVSWDLLTDGDRAIFAQCSVFRGGFTVAAAEAVIAAPSQGAVLDGLQRLVSQSLVVSERDEVGPRLRLLESMRDYAADRLGALQDTHDPAQAQIVGVTARHTAHYAALARDAVLAVREGADRCELHTVAREAENLRAVAERAAAPPGAWAAMALAAWHNTQGPVGAAMTLTHRAVALAEASGDAALLAEALIARSVSTWVFASHAAAREDTARALALAERTGDARLIARVEAHHAVALGAADERTPDLLRRARAQFLALGLAASAGRVESLLAWTYDQREDSAEAVAWSARAVATYAPCGPSRGAGVALMNHAVLLLECGRLDEARGALERSADMSAALGNPASVAGAARTLGTLELAAGDPATARPHLDKALAVELRQGRTVAVALCFFYRALCSLAEGRYDEALTDLDGASEHAGAIGDGIVGEYAHAYRALARIAAGDAPSEACDAALAALPAPDTKRARDVLAMVARLAGRDVPAGWRVDAPDDVWEVRLAHDVAATIRAATTATG